MIVDYVTLALTSLSHSLRVNRIGAVNRHRETEQGERDRAGRERRRKSRERETEQGERERRRTPE